MFLMVAEGHAYDVIELARCLVQMHAGGPEQVHGRRPKGNDSRYRCHERLLVTEE